MFLLGNKSLRQVEIVFFFAESMLSFGQYEIKSSEATLFRGSFLLRLEPTQVPLHASQFALKSVEKWRFCYRLKNVIVMPNLSAQSMLSFGQYEMKSSEATPFRGSISMQFKWLEPPQFPLHASQFAFKSVEKWKFARGWNRCNFNANYFLLNIIYAIFWSVWNKIIRVYPFPWVNFNAAWIVRTATIFPTYFSICFQICWDWRLWDRLKLL